MAGRTRAGIPNIIPDPPTTDTLPSVTAERLSPPAATGPSVIGKTTNIRCWASDWRATPGDELGAGRVTVRARTLRRRDQRTLGCLDAGRSRTLALEGRRPLVRRGRMGARVVHRRRRP